jgi:hypothetical protein
MFRTLSGFVMAKALPETGVLRKTSSTGVQYVGNYDTLVATEVVAAGPDETAIRAGDKVYVSGTCTKAPWAKARFEFNDSHVIFIPLNEVRLVEATKAPLPKMGCVNCDQGK